MSKYNGRHRPILGISMIAVAALLIIATIAAFIAGIWLDDARWGYTGVVGMFLSTVSIPLFIIGSDEL